MIKPGFWPWLVLLVIVACLAWSWQTNGIAADLLSTTTTSQQKVDALKLFFQQCGFWAPVVYVLFVTVEVIIAPIPGILLYAPGGLVFGAFWGGTLSLIGNTLGAGFSCALVRSIGHTFVDRFGEQGPVGKIQEELERRGGWWVFFLRVNPVTSTDLVSYAAGFTRISIVKLMIATCLGMAPLCYLQAWLSDAIFNQFPALIVPLIVASIAYLVVVVVVLQRVLRRTD